MAALPQPTSEPSRPAADNAELQVCALLAERGRVKQEDVVRAERLLAEAPETSLTALLVRLGLVSERSATISETERPVASCTACRT